MITIDKRGQLTGSLKGANFSKYSWKRCYVSNLSREFKTSAEYTKEAIKKAAGKFNFSSTN